MSSPRRHPSSSAAAALDDEDLLSEILLRLPPLPSSLPRASLACKLWRRIVSDARFLRRFREHHRRNPPLLGCFIQDLSTVHFEPMMEAPDRVPQARFSFPIDPPDAFLFLGCRHGLVLISLWTQNQLLVWDPITGDQHRLGIPPGLDRGETMINGAVLRAAGEVHHFQVVLVGNSDIQNTQAVASVYKSETGVWSNLVTTPLPADDLTHYADYRIMRSVMVANSLYWFLYENWFGLLEFNLDRQSLNVIHVPVDIVDVDSCLFTVMRAEGGGLGFLFISGNCIQLWKRNTDCDGVASWVLERTVALDKLLSMNSEEARIVGFAEDNNVVLLWAFSGDIFMLQFESLQLKKFFEPYCSFSWRRYYPFEGVYTADMGVGGGHDGVKLLHNT